MLSRFASSMNPQVLMITTSHACASAQSSYPPCTISASISSASTWFFEHPRDTIPTLTAMIFSFSAAYAAEAF